MNPVRLLILILGAAIGLSLLLSLALPASVSVSRLTDIDAPLASTFAQINVPRNHSKWMGPALAGIGDVEFQYTGPRQGTGANIRWQSDDARVGSGERAIIDSRENEQIELASSFEGAGEARQIFQFEGDSVKTRVSTSYELDYGFDLFGRITGLFADKMIGPELEASLARLKLRAEGLPATDFSDLDVSVVTVISARLAAVNMQSDPDSRAISAALASGFFDVLQFMRSRGLEQVGPPLSIIRGMDTQFRFDAAIPVTGDVSNDGGRVRIVDSYQGPALKIVHRGAYDGLTETHSKVAAYIAAMDFRRSSDAWESYVSDPNTVAGSDLITELYYPIAE